MGEVFLPEPLASDNGGGGGIYRSELVGWLSSYTTVCESSGRLVAAMVLPCVIVVHYMAFVLMVKSICRLGCVFGVLILQYKHESMRAGDNRTLKCVCTLKKI